MSKQQSAPKATEKAHSAPLLAFLSAHWPKTQSHT